VIVYIPSTGEDPVCVGLAMVANDDLLEVPTTSWRRLAVTDDHVINVADTDRLQREHVRLHTAPCKFTPPDTRQLDRRVVGRGGRCGLAIMGQRCAEAVDRT